jgi:hypothetical protein
MERHKKRTAMATFIGADGFAGYNTGKEYQILFQRVLGEDGIEVNLLDRETQKIKGTYRSEGAFYESWRNLHDLKDA